MKIDFANLDLEYKKHKLLFDKAISEVIESSSFIMGPAINELEEKLMSFTKCKNAITCSNGTDAILLAMMALEVKPGDEIITTPFTFISTAETISFLGAKPVFVDINPLTFNIDVNKIVNKITNKTKGILCVSLFGQTSDMDAVNDIASKYNLFVIEDAAQSFGASYKKRRSCNLSKLATTSFFPAKPLGCFGDGGAVFTNDNLLADKVRSMRVHGQKKKYHHQYIGMGGRLNTIQAAILNVKMNFYEEKIKLRQNAANNYNEMLDGFIKLPFVLNDCQSVWAQYCIQVKNRDRVQKKLKELGIPTAVYYPVPLHLQECFSFLNHKIGDFPISESVSKEILALPINPYITIEQQRYIVENLKLLIL